MNLTKICPLWKQASLFLIGLAVFFFWSYGLANRYAASLDIVPSIMYDWEQYIPFWPWTIIPYWSMDLLYGISFFICTSKHELTIHAGRLFAASCICCTLFILFPLSCSFVLPEITSPIFRWLIVGSGLVATPFNQAPSLHIALAWLVWLRFRAHTDGILRIFLSGWFVLIGLSVLTCYQHHFIDVPLGLLVGVLISYFLPVQSFERIVSPDYTKRMKLGSFYLFGSLVLASLAWYFKGGFLWLFWPALSLLLVAWGYFAGGTAVFQKNAKGELSLSVRILLSPYRLGAYLSKRWFTRHLPAYTQITDQVYLGGLPVKGTVSQNGLLDLTAEFDSSSITCKQKVCCPHMDLLALSAQQIKQATEQLIVLTQQGTVLVCCALGLSRSATIVIAYLIQTKRFSTIQQATAFVTQKRPQIVLSAKQMYYLQQWQELIQFR